MMNKKLIICFLIVLTILLASNVFAAMPGPGETLKKAWDKVMDVASLDFFKDVRTLGAFFRLAIWIILFVLFYEILSRTQVLSNKNAGIVGFVLAAVTAVAIPQSVLFAWAQMYAIGFMFVIMGVIVVGGLYLVYGVIPGNDRIQIGIRIILLIFLWYLTAVITSNFEEWLSKLGPELTGAAGTLVTAFLIPSNLLKIK